MDDFVNKSIEELGPDFPEAMAEMDLKGFLIKANKAAHELFSYSLDYNINTIGFLDVIDESDHKRAKENLHKVMFNRVLGKNDYIAVKADGTTFPVFILSAPIKKDGSTIGMRVIVFDRSENKK